MTENEFEVCNDNNTFLDCTFVIRGSVPYGYSDFYGKGGPNFGRLNKHSFMSITHANNTRIIGCQVYLQSFGHCIHFHKVDGVRIERCLLTGASARLTTFSKSGSVERRSMTFKLCTAGNGRSRATR